MRLGLLIFFQKNNVVGDEEIEAIFKPEVLEPVKKDYEYLKKMQEMDMEISLREEKDEGSEGKKGLEMTDVVPVGGLIMARFFFFLILFDFIFLIKLNLIYFSF